jgi:hypothetical protein
MTITSKRKHAHDMICYCQIQPGNRVCLICKNTCTSAYQNPKSWTTTHNYHCTNYLFGVGVTDTRFINEQNTLGRWIILLSLFYGYCFGILFHTACLRTCIHAYSCIVNVVNSTLLVRSRTFNSYTCVIFKLNFMK